MIDLEEISLDEAEQEYNGDNEQREQIAYWLKIYEEIRPHKGL